jgi:hypothetical protein
MQVEEDHIIEAYSTVDRGFLIALENVIFC